MANILCFGDSNTWGTIPTNAVKIPNQNKYRYNDNERWTALLQLALTDKHHIIEEGQPNRTLVHNEPFDGNKTGIRYLKSCLAQYYPELIIIMLGTNDLKSRFKLSAAEIGQGLTKLIEQTLSYYQSKPKILIICPPTIAEVGNYAKMYAGGAEKSKQLSQYYQQCAFDLACDFLDAGTIVTSSLEDGVHWHVEQHSLLAAALLPIIKSIMINEH